MNSKIFTIVFTLQVIMYCKGNTNKKYKSATIEKIVEKVCNITMEQVANKTLDEKPVILKNIEEKLNKSAVYFGFEGHKYIKWLIHGVKSIAYNNTKFAQYYTLPGEHTTIVDKHIRRSINETDNYHNNSVKGKDEIIVGITNKIELLANEYFKAAKTPEEKQKTLDIIRKKVLESEDKIHNWTHTKGEKNKYYSDIIMEGLNLILETNNKNARRMEKELHDNKEVDLTSTAKDRMGLISNKLNDDTDCNMITEKICAQLISLSSLSCSQVDKMIPVEKLCDDFFDCHDQSDEKNCIAQGTSKFYNTMSLWSHIYSTPIHNCFIVQLSNSVLTQQSTELRNILDTQLTFIQKYSNASSSGTPTVKIDNINNYVLKKSINEIAVVVSTLASAFEGALCTRRRSIGIFDALKEMTMEPEDDILDVYNKEEEFWEPKSCQCNGVVCANVSCNPPCPKVCMQKNSFNLLICKATNGDLSVTISVLCDGKIDCYDKTDEANCSYGATHAKFLASGYFYEILNLIKQKAASQEYLAVQYKLLALHGSVAYLQKLSISKNIDNDMLKEARDRCFSTLSSLYEYLMFKSENEVQLDNYYKYLNDIKERLVWALKSANAGNEKLGTADECICIASRCGWANCSQVCMRACSVQPKISNYYCGNTKTNNTVPIQFVCDGKPDCPKGEDEHECRQEICRKHHLLLMRQSFQNSGRNLKGTAAGEALLSWESKASLLVQLAEKENLNRQLIRKLVEDLLQGLVTAYGIIEDFRRSASKSRQLLKEFIEISRKVINTVKSCGNIN